MDRGTYDLLEDAVDAHLISGGFRLHADLECTAMVLSQLLMATIQAITSMLLHHVAYATTHIA